MNSSVKGLVLAVILSAAATSYADQCLQDATSELGLVYAGKLNIGTNVWPGYDWARVSISNSGSALFLSCSDNSCYDSHYGGNMSISSCVENSDNFIITMSGAGVSSAMVTIPKHDTKPVQSIHVVVAASDGILPNTDNSDFSYVPFS